MPGGTRSTQSGMHGKVQGTGSSDRPCTAPPPHPRGFTPALQPIFFELIAEEKSSRNQCQRQQGVQLHHSEPPSEGLTPTEHRPHLSTHLIINTPPHPTAHSATIFGNHGNHSTHQGQAELWATQGDSQFCPFKPHS